MADEGTYREGWYPDPQDVTGTQLRWWNGSEWTDQTSRATIRQRRQLEWPRAGAQSQPAAQSQRSEDAATPGFGPSSTAQPKGELESVALRERLRQLEQLERDELQAERDELSVELAKVTSDLRAIASRVERDIHAIRGSVGWILFLLVLPLIIGFVLGFIYGVQNN